MALVLQMTTTNTIRERLFVECTSPTAPSDKSTPNRKRKLFAMHEDTRDDDEWEYDFLIAGQNAIGVLPVGTRVPILHALELCATACGPTFPSVRAEQLRLLFKLLTHSRRLIKVESQNIFRVN